MRIHVLKGILLSVFVRNNVITSEKPPNLYGWHLQRQSYTLFSLSRDDGFVQSKFVVYYSLCFLFLAVFLLNVLNLVFHKPRTYTQL